MAAMLYARRFHDEIAFDEYMQLASVGLIEAVERFDASLGVPFEAYAMHRIRGEVLNGLQRLTEKNLQIAADLRRRRERVASLARSDTKEKGRIATIDDDASATRRDRDPEALFDYLAEVGVGMALALLLDEGSGMLDAAAFGLSASAPSAEVVYFERRGLRDMRNTVLALFDQLTPQQRKVLQLHYFEDLRFVDIARLLHLTRGRISQLHREGLMRLRKLLRQPAQEVIV